MIGGYKVGFTLALRMGLSCLVDEVKRVADDWGLPPKPVIYDHQKAGTDIPDMGEPFALLCKEAGVSAVILFPQSGPETERAWIKAAQDQQLSVIVGGFMTHKKYAVSEGGWIADSAARRDIYKVAADLGVTEFVMPGNKVEICKEIQESAQSPEERVFYSPGFIAQTGVISETAKIVGSRWHAIVGRGILQAEDKRAAALKLGAQLG